jgi:branched-chain amino acid aminotransferase
MSDSLNLEWGSLPFGYVKTDYNIRSYYRDGKWGELEVTSSEHIMLHMASISIHYGQQAFEGLKAFRGKDGKIRLFRWEENAKRLQSSAEGILMPPVPTKMFEEAIFKAIRLNERFVPPYGSGASLYLRPYLFGSGFGVGVKPANEYMFGVFVSPVGPYFKTGFKPVNMLLIHEFDRAAPLGTGHIKVGGNYASGLKATQLAHSLGYANVIFIDSKEKKYIDECGPANFFAIKDNTYITPKSDSILPSITNKSLEVISQSIGLKTERRPILVTELPEFEEVGACGTAAVITPIGKIVDQLSQKEYIYQTEEAGKISTKLYNTLLSIQNGDLPDDYGWVSYV